MERTTLPIGAPVHRHIVCIKCRTTLLRCHCSQDCQPVMEEASGCRICDPRPPKEEEKDDDE